MLKMEINGGTSAATPTVSAVAVATVKETTTPINSPSPTSSPPPPPLSPQQTVVLSPCAACKILRRRCAEKCVLAPYFPPTDPAKFTIAHRVFGASNIIKFLQELPESQRTDAVNSMVYEAGARMRDPVYGCAGAIYHLQRQVSELQAQLVKTQVELVSMQLQRSDLLELLYKMEQTKLAAQEQGQQNTAGKDVLTEHDSGDVDHGGAVGGAGERVRHGQEDRVAEAVVEEEVLVQEKDSYVGTEPGGDAAVRTEGDTVGEEKKKGFPLEEAEECGGVPGMSMTVGVVVATLGMLIRRVVHD